MAGNNYEILSTDFVKKLGCDNLGKKQIETSLLLWCNGRIQSSTVQTRRPLINT